MDKELIKAWVLIFSILISISFCSCFLTERFTTNTMLENYCVSEQYLGHMRINNIHHCYDENNHVRIDWYYED